MAEKIGKRQHIDSWTSEEGLLLIEGWAKDGLTEVQIAKNMGISNSTLIAWKKKSPIFQKALKTSKAVADRVIENALYKRAKGYEYTETTQERKLNPVTGQYEMVTTKIVNKVALPDTTAQVFWLKNRKPDEWRDRREIESNEAIEKLDGILNGMLKTAKGE